MRKDITVERIVQDAIDSDRATRYHIMPGIVAAYYPGTPGVPASIDVQPAVNDVRFTTATGARFSEPFPLIPKVPILFPYMGAFFVAGPMLAGDKVVLLGFDLDPTAHIQSGQSADPPDARRHVGSYWCAIPGDICTPDALADGAAAALTPIVGLDGDPAQVRFAPGSIQLGRAAVMPVALAPPLVTALQALGTYTAALTAAATAGAASPDPTGAAFQTFAIALQGVGAAIAAAMSTAETATPATIVKGQ